MDMASLKCANLSHILMIVLVMFLLYTYVHKSFWNEYYSIGQCLLYKKILAPQLDHIRMQLLIFQKVVTLYDGLAKQFGHVLDVFASSLTRLVLSSHRIILMCLY
jgi:hypothetical protein